MYIITKSYLQTNAIKESFLHILLLLLSSNRSQLDEKQKEKVHLSTFGGVL
jgi:hypothetical protein